MGTSRELPSLIPIYVVIENLAGSCRANDANAIGCSLQDADSGIAKGPDNARTNRSAKTRVPEIRTHRAVCGMACKARTVWGRSFLAIKNLSQSGTNAGCIGKATKGNSNSSRGRVEYTNFANTTPSVGDVE
jgi:hypothetical protein